MLKTETWSCIETSVDTQPAPTSNQTLCCLTKIQGFFLGCVWLRKLQLELQVSNLYSSILHVGLLGSAWQLSIDYWCWKDMFNCYYPKEIRFRKVAQFKCLIKQLICYFHRTVVFTAVSLIQCASETSKFLKRKPTLMTCGSSCHSIYALYVFQDNKYHTPRYDSLSYIFLLYFALGQILQGLHYL